ncbi:MAG: class I adenylate-forming enzyme family protein, partial [Nakamurella sp.]
THIRSRFEAGPLIDLLLDNAATALFAVPAMHQRLVGHPRVGELAGLRLVISGSAPLSAELCERLAAELGQPPVERYGLTESGLDISNPYDGPRVPGTVGYPLPGVEVRLAASDTTDEPSETTTEGEITLRGPQIFTGYWQDESATDAAFLPGGWFRTGDLGRRDDDGRLTISGRLKELIISGGFNVMPAEVEQCLEQHGDVAEAAVAGVPSERWGEEVTAWVVPVGDSVDTDGLLALAREQLAPYKVPKRVLSVDSLPRNAMGKIVRSELSVEND